MYCGLSVWSIAERFVGKDSIVVMYDWLRGEPRQNQEGSGTETKGDCIDCKLCVHARPWELISAMAYPIGMCQPCRM